MVDQDENSDSIERMIAISILTHQGSRELTHQQIKIKHWKRRRKR